MNSRWSSVALLFVLAGLSIPQTSTTYVTPAIRRVGDKLACKCGTCSNTIGDCPMIACHYSSPAREKIASMQKNGVSDDAIIDNFVKEVGLAALAAPPTKGFSLVGWLMPFAGILLGLAAIFAYISHIRKPAPTTATGPAKVDERYREQIEREMAELE